MTVDPPITENSENKQPLGTSANELLSSDLFTSVRIEVAYPEGFRPSQTTIDSIAPFLAKRIDKPLGITIKESVITTNLEGRYDIDDIVAIEDNNRTVFNNDTELGIWLFFSDQQSDNDVGNSVVLGTAYRNTSMVIFEKTFLELANTSPTAINRTLIETSTIRHELGHILGLVNIGTPLISDHEDETNTRHCNVVDCLMFFQTVTNVFNNSMFSSIPEFDTFCIQDLQANGGL